MIVKLIINILFINYNRGEEKSQNNNMGTKGTSLLLSSPGKFDPKNGFQQKVVPKRAYYTSKGFLIINFVINFIFYFILLSFVSFFHCIIYFFLKNNKTK